jgi:hypothetical protein
MQDQTDETSGIPGGAVEPFPCVQAAAVTFLKAAVRLSAERMPAFGEVPLTNFVIAW